MSPFGAELAAVLTRHGWSQRRFSDLIDCEWSHISRLVSGQRNPSRVLLDWMCGVVETDECVALNCAAGFLPVELSDPSVRDDLVRLARDVRQAA